MLPSSSKEHGEAGNDALIPRLHFSEGQYCVCEGADEDSDEDSDDALAKVLKKKQLVESGRQRLSLAAR